MTRVSQTRKKKAAVVGKVKVRLQAAGVIAKC